MVHDHRRGLVTEACFVLIVALLGLLAGGDIEHGVGGTGGEIRRQLGSIRLRVASEEVLGEAGVVDGNLVATVNEGDPSCPIDVFQPRRIEQGGGCGEGHGVVGPDREVAATEKWAEAEKSTEQFRLTLHQRRSPLAA